MIRNAADEKLINDYFEHPKAKENLAANCGQFGKITVDWEREKITAAGEKGGREWALGEFLTMLKTGGGLH